MDRRVQPPHARLLAHDLLNLTVRNTIPPTFLYPGTTHPIVFAETLGYVVTRERKDKYLRFIVDDGTGCVPCVLWMNQRQVAAQGWRRHPDPDPDFAAEMAESLAAPVQLGAVLRVRGRVTAYRGQIQVTVAGVVQERDPNVQMLHWLDCIKLARCCYSSLLPPAPPVAAHGDGAERKKKKTVASTSHGSSSWQRNEGAD